MSRIFDYGNISINDFMRELLSLQETDRVLEIGFGTGKLIAEMAGVVKKGRIEGIDFSGTMVAIAEKRNEKYIAEGRVALRQGDFEKIDYEDTSYDKICSANTIYFWPHPDRCIKKISKILRPGGKSILAFEDKAQLEKRPLSKNVFHIYSEDEIENLLSCNGFGGSVDILTRKIGSLIFHCAVAAK